MKLFKKITICLLTGLFFAISNYAQSPSRPNVILIVVDDLNDYIQGFDGHPQVETPNIASLAAGGYLFTNAFCNAPVCAASRTSFMSGKDLKYTQVYDNNNYVTDFRGNFTAALGNEEVVSLPQQLKDAGNYFTIGYNKIYHEQAGSDYDEDTPVRCEKELSWCYQNDFHDLPGVDSISKTYNEGINKFNWGRIDDSLDLLIKDGRVTDSVIWMIDQIANGNIELCDSTFFMAIGYSLPHLDLYVPQQYYSSHYLVDIYDGVFNYPFNFPYNAFPPNGIVMPPQPEIKWDDYNHLGPLGKAIAKGQNDIEKSFTDYTNALDYLPEIDPGLSDSLRWEYVAEAKRANAIMAYMAGIKDIDGQVGRILNYLDTKPEIRDNTIIIFIGDNGFSLGEKRHWTKRSFWEPDVRIPLIIYDPNRTGNVVCTQTVGLLDLFPTICDMTDTPYPTFADGSDYLDGVSILPILNSPTLPFERPVLMTVEAEDSKECSCFPQYGVRNGRFKYIRYQSDGGNPSNQCIEATSYFEEELYDIGVNRENDPNEWKNLITDPDYDKVKHYLQQWMPDSSLYLEKTNTVKIGVSGTVPCFLKNSSKIKLNSTTYNPDGALMATTPGLTYKWTDNLTTAVHFGKSYTFNMATVPAAAYASNDHIMFYLEVTQTATGKLIAFDTRTFYINNANIPTATYTLLTDTTLLSTTVNGYVINGSYTNTFWNFGDGTIVEDLIPDTHYYAGAGYYTVDNNIQYGNACVKHVKRYANLLRSGSADFTCTVYPNPANAFINITADLQSKVFDVDIINTIGQVVISETNLSSENAASIDIRSIPAGSYLVEIRSDGLLHNEIIQVVR